ncbi:MAG: DUF3575 domain-containing protein [Bacteroidaceae bacterium]|nr:DUF3575 domain-containing protein [Bacteroidaceae bacterium]
MIAGKTIGTISKGRIRSIVLMLFLCGISLCCFSQTVVLKNNFLYDATLTPNLGIEVRLDDKWTAGLNVGYQPWPFDDKTERKLRHLLISPEVRYWFCDVFSGWFIGANAFYSHFNVSKVNLLGLYPSVKNRRKQGDAFAGGIFGGHSWILSPRWSIEAEAGIDVGSAKYKEYECAHCGEYFGEDNKVFLAPKVGINIIYNLK